MRFRATIRNEGTEIRGYATGEDVVAISKGLSESGSSAMVVASPVDESYNPFRRPAIEQVAERLRTAFIEHIVAERGMPPALDDPMAHSRTTPWNQLSYQRRQKWIEMAKAVMD